MSAEEKPRRLCSEIQLFDLCAKTVCKKRMAGFAPMKQCCRNLRPSARKMISPPNSILSKKGTMVKWVVMRRRKPTPGYSEDYDDDEEDYDDEP
jgi:hypothetical protein